MIIFRWDFFKTISTRSENSISGLTRDIPAPWKEVSTKKVVKLNLKKLIFEKIWNFHFGQFLDRKCHFHDLTFYTHSQRNPKMWFLRFSREFRVAKRDESTIGLKTQKVRQKNKIHNSTIWTDFMDDLWLFRQHDCYSTSTWSKNFISNVF